MRRVSLDTSMFEDDKLCQRTCSEIAKNNLCSQKRAGKIWNSRFSKKDKVCSQERNMSTNDDRWAWKVPVCSREDWYTTSMISFWGKIPKNLEDWYCDKKWLLFVVETVGCTQKILRPLMSAENRRTNGRARAQAVIGVGGDLSLNGLMVIAFYVIRRKTVSYIWKEFLKNTLARSLQEMAAVTMQSAGRT